MARFAYGNVLNSALRLPRSNGFSPSALFAASEPGAWYDPSDLSTMFQDSAGTTPVTATGQTVGLVLDKSKGLVLGPELVTNGDFSQGATGWDSSNATLSVVSGALRIASQTASPATTTQAINGLVIGRTYVFTATYWQGGTGGTAARVSFAGITSQNNSTSTPLTVRFMAVAAASFATIGLQSFGTSATESYFDNISVKELPGNHATQATAASRPIYGIEPFGGRRNLLTFTEQFDNAAWVKTNATVSGDSTTAPDGTLTADTITLTGISVGAKQLASSSALARCYSFYVKNNSGARYFQILTDGTANAFANFDIQAEVVGSRGSSASASSITSVGNGWYRIQMTATDASATNIYIALVGSNTAGWSSGASSGSFYVWGAQLELGSTATAYQRVTDQWNVTQAGVPSVSYVQYDGTDDWFISPTITPGIDKAQVFAGVRKLSDAAQGCLIGTFNTGTAGLFELGVPRLAGERYGWVSYGTAASTAVTTSTAFNAPITNVLTGIGDIAADVATLRVNGVQAATSATDQGTGNFNAYPLYVGRRGGTSLPFNGRLYALAVRFGANLSSDQISQMETWMAGKTGLTL